MVDLARALRTAAQTGTVRIGYKSSLDAAKGKEAKALVLARNLPEDTRKTLTDAAGKGNVPLIEFEGTNVELGPALGKPFAVACAAIIAPGESDILHAVRR